MAGLFVNNVATHLRTMSRLITTVPLEGLEPPTVSLGRNCSSIELQRLASSSLAEGVQSTGEAIASRRCSPHGSGVATIHS